MASKDFPRMIYHKKTGANLIVHNDADLKEKTQNEYQLVPLPPDKIVSREEKMLQREAELDARSIILDTREAELNRRESALTEKQELINRPLNAKSAR